MKYRLDKLNDNQRKAVVTTDGPVLIIAGPGSGKTFTLVERVIYLIVKKNVSPSNILISTFTEKAAKEIVTRISNRLDDIGVEIDLNEMYIGTLHSICLRILKDNLQYTRIKKNYRMMDQFEQQYFVYQSIYKFRGIDGFEALFEGKKISRWNQSGQLVKWINKISEENVDIDKLLDFDNYQIQLIGEVYNKYNSLMDEENTLDFSGIQVEAYTLLKNNPEILHRLQEQIKYLMIDEYQDTNTIQEKIIFKLAGDKQNICVVGDDDQGLYRFRGATIRNILEFPKNFDGNCTIVRLDTNYRSHPDIVDFYNKWMEEIDWDGFRYDKTIKPRDGEFVSNPSVIKVSGEDLEENWHESVVDFIKTSQREGKVTDLNQIAFLFRSVKNEKVVRLAQYLEENNIPVYSPRANMFFDREEIKYMIGGILTVFLGQVQNIRDEDPQNELWAYYDECMELYADYLNSDIELLKWTKKMINQHMIMKENTDYAFSGIFYRLLQFDLFKQYLDGDNLEKVKDSRASRNLAIMSNLLTKFEYLHNISVFSKEYVEKNIEKLLNVYIRFLKDGGISEYEDMSEYAPSGCVSFMTIHQSKGMEFPVVFVGSLEGVPKKQYDDVDEMLQNYIYDKKPFEPLERTKEFDFWRLYYTAFSRAQNILCLTCPETVNRQKRQRQVPSKYFEDLYKTIKSWEDSDFSIEKVELEKVKASNIKSNYSYTSHVLLFENCARQYKFYKELEFSPVRKSATIFGTLVHQTIEDIHRAVLRGEEHLVNKEQITRWFYINYNSIVKKEKTHLMPSTQQVALKQVLRYAENNTSMINRVKEAEVEVSLVKPEYILKGTIDLVEGHGESIELVDFKSEKKPDIHKEREKIDRYRRQLEIYAHLIEKKTNYKVSKLHLYYTGEENGSPYISFNKDLNSIDSTIKEIDNVVDKIEKKKFNICELPDEKLCGNCDIRFYCGYRK